MDHLVQKKLNVIADIWNEFIWDYKFCNNKIKFTEDVRSNYLGDILHYFSDTFTVIFKKRVPKKFYSSFESAVSFLQAIYIQQDFVEEMLSIFKCNISKGDLKKDKNYEINREIRNELVGHPIRKTLFKNDKRGDNEQVLLSSTIFSNRLNNTQISYLRYHRENSYKFEEITHLRKDIIDRHLLFLDKYFNIIILKLITILRKFGKKLASLDKNIDKAPFDQVISLASHYFESIFSHSPLFKSHLLMLAYNKREAHPRYLNAVNNFLRIFKASINETGARIKSYDFDPAQISIEKKRVQKGTVRFILEEEDNEEKIEKRSPKVSCHYELGKLSEKRSQSDFDFFSSMLREKCQDKSDVLNELDYMRENFENDFEYQCAYQMVQNILKED